ncbi:hypothetical protein Droror1_Dr00002864 [Drosera rotundifolia]
MGVHARTPLFLRISPNHHHLHHSPQILSASSLPTIINSLDTFISRSAPLFSSESPGPYETTKLRICKEPFKQTVRLLELEVVFGFLCWKSGKKLKQRLDLSLAERRYLAAGSRSGYAVLDFGDFGAEDSLLEHHRSLPPATLLSPSPKYQMEPLIYFLGKAHGFSRSFG